MDRSLLEARFGKKFVALIDDSPLLQRDLRALARLKCRVRRWNGKHAAYSRTDIKDRRKALIVIGSKGTPLDKVLQFAHEAYHVLKGFTPSFPDPKVMSRAQYLASSIAEETRAVMHEARVAEELYDKGYLVPARHLRALVELHRGGYSAIKADVEASMASISNESYRDTYGRYYDQHVAALERKRLRRLEARRVVRSA